MPLFVGWRGLGMYQHTMIPVGLAHIDKSEAVVADLAKYCDAAVTDVAITSNVPGVKAHNLKGFAGTRFPSHGRVFVRHTSASIFPARVH